MNKKSVTIAFLGNPHFDTRVNNLAASLKKDGYDINVIGFDWRNPDFKTESGEVKVYKLHKGKFSLLFYLKYAVLLKLFLFRSKSDIYFAEDIYTLPFVYIYARIKKAKVIYNSRELFGFLAGLRKKKLVQSLISCIEQYFIKKVDLVLTTGEMDTEFIKTQYKITNVLTIRNLPVLQQPKSVVDFREMFNLSSEIKILFYQGVLFDGRGLEITIKSLRDIPNAVFVICGSGEQKQKFVDLVKYHNVEDKVFFLGAIDQAELINYTAGADLGLSLIENISISYYYALPNKMFEYMMASLPLVVSDLPQMRNIVDKYETGEVIDIENKNSISVELKKLLGDKEQLDKYRTNCKTAAAELNWQKEYEKLKDALTGLEK